MAGTSIIQTVNQLAACVAAIVFEVWTPNGTDNTQLCLGDHRANPTDPSEWRTDQGIVIGFINREPTIIITKEGVWRFAGSASCKSYLKVYNAFDRLTSELGLEAIGNLEGSDLYIVNTVNQIPITSPATKIISVN